MNKYNINDKVFCINMELHRIECGTIRKIIIEEKEIKYDIKLLGYSTYRSVTVEEDLISITVDELYQKLKDNIEKYFPLVWR